MSDTTPELLRFFGSFHPLLVHLPIGFLVLVILFEILAILPSCRHLSAANRAILALAIPFTAASAACGWWMAEEGGYQEELLGWHRWGGVALVAVVPVLLILHWREARKAYLAGLAVAAALLGATGHYGGSLTHGSDFLARHAPPALRPYLGGKPARTTSADATSGPAIPGSDAPVFEAAVMPRLEEYCNACHGAEKSKGDLRLDSLEAILKGGDTGPAIVAGNSSQSLLIQRIRLPEDDDEHMPPEGKKQPSADDLAVLAWWIDAGGVAGRSARDLGAPDSILQILARNPASPAPASATTPPPPSEETDSAPAAQTP